MAIWKRYRQKRVKRGHADYNKGTWVAEGKVDGVPYKKALPKESVKTAEQARAADDEIRSKIRAGEFDFLKDTTLFREYAEGPYLTFLKNNLAEITVKNKRLELNTLNSFFGDKPLKKITPSDCESFKAWRIAQKAKCQRCVNGIEHVCLQPTVKTSSVNPELRTLRTLFKNAQADRKLSTNPMQFVKLFPVEKYEAATLAENSRVKLWNVIKEDYQFFRICVIALLAGWRRNQILHLRKDDLMLDERKVWLIRQKKGAKRKVPVNSVVWSILMELAEIREDWLFIGPNGERRKSIDTAWKKARKLAGINIRFHDLRHTFTSNLIETAPGFVAQHALGHTRYATTQGYMHVKDEHLMLALEALKTDDIPLADAIQTPSENVM
jgi:integrase